jgi:hypothetical protein
MRLPIWSPQAMSSHMGRTNSPRGSRNLSYKAAQAAFFFAAVRTRPNQVNEWLTTGGPQAFRDD